LRDLLDDYAFPGNIRELLNIVQRAAIFMEDATDLEDLFAELLAPVSDAPDLAGVASLDLRSEVRRFERALIDKAIRLHGSKRKAAKLLGVDIGTIVRKTAETVEQAQTVINRERGK
jgi:transcriptional regulator with PAS, ATPase and Fis domain